MLKTQPFPGSRSHNIELATHKDKIYIPKPLSKNVIDLYHTYLMHPGSTSTEETINQNLYCTVLQG